MFQFLFNHVSSRLLRSFKEYYTPNHPMTTQRLLEEDPNIGKQAAKAAYKHPRNEGHHARLPQHWRGKTASRGGAFTSLTSSNQISEKSYRCDPATHNNFLDSFAPILGQCYFTKRPNKVRGHLCILVYGYIYV